jgi:peptidoglycan-N-acetylglucosamine deacetylase
VVTRRRLLLGAGAGAAGVALGAVGLERSPSTAHAATPRDARSREDAGAAGPYGTPGRLGIRQVIWSTEPVDPYAAISFDDGPNPEFTPRILDDLAAAGVRATFFAMGWAAVRHPDLIRAIIAGEHEIGNHTWTHLNPAGLDSPQIREEILRCKTEVENLTHTPLIGFRPPRGELTGYALRVCAELGYDAYMWSIERGPSGVSTPAAVTEHLVDNVQAGDIIDLHDGIGRGTFSPNASFAKVLAARREVEVQALPTVLKEIAAKGIRLTTVTDLVRHSTPAASAGLPSA